MTREHVEIPIDAVNEPDAPTRLSIDDADLAALADSMRAHGQLQPGGVVPEGDRFTISYGHRRFLAAKLAGLPCYTAYVYASTSEAMLGAQLDENVIRADLSPVEEASWFAQLLDALGGDTDTLAARLHKSRAYVEGRLNLLRGDPRVLEELTKERITLGVAQRLNAYDNPGDRLVLLDAAAAGGASERLVTQWIAERKALAASRGDLPMVDASVLPTPAGVDAPETVRCLLCKSDQHVYLMRPIWLHNVCEDILRGILAQHFGGAHAAEVAAPVKAV